MGESESVVRITRSTAVPLREIRYEFTPAGGPGGQHVNRSSTRVTLCFDLGASAALSDVQKARLRRALPGRISREGVLRVTCGRRRSQMQNRDEVLARFQRLLQDALRQGKRRKRTRPTRASKERRLRDKKARAARKQLRGRVTDHQ